jgi:toxin ParE1/3/4
VKRPATLAPEARAELQAALQRIAADNLAAAKGLNDAVDAAARRIGANPSIGARRPGLLPDRYRFWPLPRYRYVLVYAADTEPPRILRILHTARDLPTLLATLKP